MTDVRYRAATSHACVRAAAPSDAKGVRAVAVETWWETYGSILEPEEIRGHLAVYYAPESLVRRIATREAEWMVAELNGECVGYGSILVVGRRAELATLYVVRRARGRGLGRALLERALDVARREGAQEVRVTYALVNWCAERFYAAAGFRETGRHRRGGHGAAVVTATLAL